MRGEEKIKEKILMLKAPGLMNPPLCQIRFKTGDRLTVFHNPARAGGAFRTYERKLNNSFFEYKRACPFDG